MSMALVCVGRLREKPHRLLADEYIRRLTRYGKFEELEIPDLPEPPGGNSPALEDQVRQREGESILRQIRPGDRVIALTIPGKEMSSTELAAHISDLRTGGAGRIVFVIGGSLGLGQNVLSRADEELSMGRMTFPHQLARVMLLEQLYRAEKIIAGERYHK